MLDSFWCWCCSQRRSGGGGSIGWGWTACCWGANCTWGDMTIADVCATGGAGVIGEAGIMGWVWFHQGICICSPLGHLPCLFLFLMYFIMYCSITVSRNPRKIPNRRLEPSIWARQLKFIRPVLLVDSLCLIMSPKTELSQAPCISRGQMRGTAEFCWHLPACAFVPHIVSLVMWKCT